MPNDADARLRRALRGVAGITLASGALQMVKPGLVLGQIAHDNGPLDRQLFATIGMFMTVSGGTLHRSLAPSQPQRGPLTWAAAQKLGASAAVGIGTRRGLFSRRALLVASFDLVSGLACLAYVRRLDRPPTGE